MTGSSPGGRRVLITNVWMDRPGGTESVARDVALGLLRRGHRPIVYSPTLGAVARALHERGVAVIDDLANLAEPPDVIHGQHFIQTAEALLHFPNTPAIQLCHAWQFWQEAPARFPQVGRYLAVDEAVRDRLVQMEGVPPDKVELLLNSVDLTRTPPRRAALPARPLRALAFTKTKSQLPFVEAACREIGAHLEVLGLGGDRLVLDPEQVLAQADVVFATARMALEALCAGCAVVVCDARGLAGLVTSENFSTLRRLNFGLRALVRPVTVEAIRGELDRYDAEDAARVAARAREDADFERMLDRLMAHYEAVMALPPPDPAEIHAAAMAFLTRALPRARSDGRWPWMTERDTLTKRIDELDGELAKARAELLQLTASRKGG
jgi:hypothetical protein